MWTNDALWVNIRFILDNLDRTMKKEWQLAEAKNRLSEVVSKALGEGPQRITRRGEAVIVVSEAEYTLLTGERVGFVDYLMSGPSFEDVEIGRDCAPMRDVDL